jgi:hypothetical protein
VGERRPQRVLVVEGPHGGVAGEPKRVPPLVTEGQVRFKRATKAVNRSLEMVKYSLALVLWERKLIPEIYIISVDTMKKSVLSQDLLDLLNSVL